MDPQIAVGGVISSIDYRPLVLFIAGSLLFLVFVTLYVFILNRRFYKTTTVEWHEVTPPQAVAKDPVASEYLFSIIHGSLGSLPLRDRILNRSPLFRFEITSSKQAGIRYRIGVAPSQSEQLKNTIETYLPNSLITRIDAPTVRHSNVLTAKQRRHFALPLKHSSHSDPLDPLAYVTGAMANLSDSESITLQLIVQPIVSREARSLLLRLQSGENIISRINNRSMSVTSRIGFIVGQFFLDVFTIIRPSQNLSTPHSTTLRVGHSLSQSDSLYEQDLLDLVRQKLAQPLFRVDMRVAVQSQQPRQRLNSLHAALSNYSVSGLQTLAIKRRKSLFLMYYLRIVHHRLPSIFPKDHLLLSASELAGFFHFPSQRVSRTDNLISSLSKTLPAPISLKSPISKAIILGENTHHGVSTPIGLSDSERERHVYIIGGTGNGKTTLLTYAIIQDMKRGKGLAVIDPHGDLAESLLRHVPEDRIKDVIYLNPDDLSYPIGINLLELPAGLVGDELLREKDRVTESVISVLRKTFSEDDSGGHRIEYVLRNTIQTALTLEAPTLFTIFELLNDPSFRRSVVAGLEDENLRNFWTQELGKAGDMQRVKMIAGITAKIGRFLFSAAAKRMLEQTRSTIDFDDVINSGKILICNFSKGTLGEDTSALFGTTILAKLQLAALRRSRLPAAKRRAFYLYVDEFQNFATMGFVQMLSEARKYQLLLIMAEQSTSQQDERRLVEIILANVGTVITFRSGSPADEKMLLPLFSGFLESGEIMNLSAYAFYVRIAAITSQEPLSGRTILLEERGNETVAGRVIESSRSLYGVAGHEMTAAPAKSRDGSSQLVRQTAKNTKRSITPLHSTGT